MNRPIECEFLYCPRCASPNGAVGQTPFRCVACGFSEYFGPVAAVGGLIRNDQGELLMVRRARDPGKGQWGLPGGFIDRDETAEQALVREIREETGLKIAGAVYLMSYPNRYKHSGMVAPVLDMFFDCRVAGTADVDIAVDELEHFEWTQPGDTHLRNMAFESNRLAVERWLQQHARSG